jgi:hypothetical protein
MSDTSTGPSIRDALTSAFDKPSAPTPTMAPTATPPASPATPAASVATPSTPPAAQGADKAAPAPAATTPVTAAAEPSAESRDQDGTQEVPAEATPATETPKPAVPALKAPQSWRPELREKFGALPPDVQQEINRRERDMAVAYKQSAMQRQLAEGFQRVVQPYAGMIQAEGGDPLRAVDSLLKTAAALRTAPVQHKAHLIANMAMTFGVPIDALDAALAGQPPPQSEQQTQQHIDPNALAHQVRQSVFQDFERQRQAAVNQRAQQETEAFLSSGKAEFFEDVREDVADLMELRARRGIEISLEKAYNEVVATHPKTAQVLRQREQASQANAAQASTQRARAAASSVRTTPAASPAPKDTSLRGTLEAAFASASGR